MTAAFSQCHYIKPKTREQCTAQSVVDHPDDGLLLCTRHLALAAEMIRDRLTKAKSLRKEAAS